LLAEMGIPALRYGVEEYQQDREAFDQRRYVGPGLRPDGAA
jgi:hypothetical protein